MSLQEDAELLAKTLEKKTETQQEMEARVAEFEGKPKPWILGVNTRSYPKELIYTTNAPEEPYVEITVVLVCGDIGDYAAYAGCWTPRFVAKLGNKIPFEEAQVHFCGALRRECYRG